MLIVAVSGNAQVSSYVDTLTLTALPPDSISVESQGRNILVRWYPPPDSVATVIGSLDFTNWFGSYDPNRISNVSFSGYYKGDINIDRSLRFSKIGASTDTVGVTSNLRIGIETVDRVSRTFRATINVGAMYTPGDPIPIVLIEAEAPFDTLDTGVIAHFGAGIIDTLLGGFEPFFQVDLQDAEGFHVWRGLSEWPSEMINIVDLSKEDAYIGVDFDSLYFLEYPKQDAQGRNYYEWLDQNTFVGFTYYYTVTSYDRGYFKGFNPHNKWDSYICEDRDSDFVQNYPPPYGPVACRDATVRITLSVAAGTDMAKVFAVPNPYRTGTSAVTTPFYHNYPDGSIKFFNVPREADLKIYTVSGDLVWDTHHSSSDGSNGVISWNVRNKHGLDVGSGVYVFTCENTENGDQVYGRIVVIR